MRHKLRYLVLLLMVAMLTLSIPNALAADSSSQTGATGSITAIAASAKLSVVGILNTMNATRSTNRGRAAGTGFVYQAGVIITNAHVVKNASELRILFPDKTVEIVDPNTQVSSDDVADIAVIKVKKANLTPLAFADSDQVQVGQGVIAIGNPLGFRLGSSVSAGILSGTGRAIGSGYPYLQTDAAINPGNSGGPLLDLNGKVIGINAAKEVNFGVEGLAFAIPSNTAKNIADRLLTDGKIERATLGITLVEDWQAEFGVPNSEGLTISDTIADGPAGLTALRSGDVLIKLDDTPVYTVDDYDSFMNTKSPGDSVRITVRRSGQLLSVTVVCASLSDMRKAAEGGNAAPQQGILLNLAQGQIQDAAEYGRSLSRGFAQVNHNYFAVSGNSFAVLYTEFMYVARRVSSAYEFQFTPSAAFKQAVAADIAGKLELDMELTGDQINFLQGATYSISQVDNGYSVSGRLQGAVNYAASPDGSVVIADLAVRFTSAGIDPTQDLTVTVKPTNGKNYQFHFTIKDLR